MASPQNSGSTLVRASKSPITESQFEALVREAGEHPERTQEIAAELGIGKPESVLHLALTGYPFPPPEPDAWFDAPPPGSFDAGIARVMGEADLVGFERWGRGNGLRMQDSYADVVGDLEAEVKRSYGFARYVVLLRGSIQMGRDGDMTADEEQTSAESDIAKMAAVAFAAGWRMAMEHESLRRAQRESEGGAR